MRIGNIVDATETIRPQHSDITHENTCIDYACVYYKLTTITYKSQPTYLHLLLQQYQPTRSLQLASHNLMALSTFSGVNASSRLEGKNQRMDWDVGGEHPSYSRMKTA